ncbi:hypothetical protein [Oryzibacter oryziterrae]|uniref:hypothetical protein n=1 Tax=Oryzibacter oryziterrae TaxID=2766474 RepID=UPI001F2139AB|nr:hypothetical protein [Oryzibacter oryziterrae]
MANRSTESTVTFRHPFLLKPLDDVQPAGTYKVVTDLEDIPGLSFVASRATAFWFHIPSLAESAMATSVFPIRQEDLDAALALDLRGGIPKGQVQSRPTL